MACLFDARGWVEWTTITLSVSLSGSFSYTNGAGHTISGSMTGSSTLVLNRADFDRHAAPTLAGQALPQAEFLTFRSCHTCPVILLHGEPDVEGSGSVSITITDTPPEDEASTVTGSGAARFGLSLGTVEGCDCGEPETPITALAFSIPDLFGVELFDVGGTAALVTGAVLPWAGGTYSETLSLDLLSPVDGITVIGSQSAVLSLAASG